MQFQNPEILYFLALLIIPILVHLFQLQKFVKTPFTNVTFLQKLVQQTRKSSRIKKWLILATRLLLFLAIIFAFSQPYFSNKKTDIKQQTFIYLDNSLSTNATGKKGNLLKITAQEIIENASKKDTYILQTNTDYFADITYQTLKDKLLKVTNSSKKNIIKPILLQVNSIQKNKSNTSYKNILISDFQNTYKNEFTNVTTLFSAIKLESSKKDNISIDSVFINNTNTTELSINVIINNQGKDKNNIPIALYNKEKLISKQTFSIDENTKKKLVFKTQNITDFLGKIQITFSDTFTFDNTFLFTINNNQKTNILCIGNHTDYLSKIYTKDEFNFTTSTLQNTNYNAIQKQQIIILNELKNIPDILAKNIVDFSKNGGTVVIIPNLKSDLQSYNLFLTKIANSRIQSKILDTLKITNINFNHPLFQNVFSKKVLNFQYPSIYSHYPLISKNNSNILTLENNAPFISEINSGKSKVYWVSSALSKKNSNFLNSPLIVPVFYNFGKLSFKHKKLYHYLDEENKIDIAANLKKDEILSITNNNSTFIPLQKTYQNKVRIITKDNLTKRGFYHIINNKDTLQTIAFNNPKEESLLNFLNLTSLQKKHKNIDISTSITNVFNDLNEKNEVRWLWKWFLALAIVSLLLEIFILKFYKP